MQRLRAWITVVLGHLSFAIVAFPALGYAIAATHDLTWPYDIDFCREIAQAQVFADGDLQSEAFYLGERVWYPPLAPALVALLARITGAPVPIIYARAGAYVNFLAPLFLYFFVRRSFGRFVALATIVDFLYMRPYWVPGWVAGTYSPWLLSGTFAQVCFIGGLLAYDAACRRPSAGRLALSGVCLSLAVLAHASAGLLLAVVILGAAVIQAWNRSTRITAIKRHAAIAAWSAIVAAPYYVALAVHYWHGVANTIPARWIWSGLRDFESIIAQLSWSLLLAPLGLHVLLTRERRQPAAQMALMWIGASALLLIAGRIVPVVPAHHLTAYMRAGLSLFVGVGAGVLARVIARRFAPDFRLPAWGEITASLLALLFIIPTYPKKRDLWQGRLLSERQGNRPNQMEAYAWLRVHVAANNVVLASDELSMNIAGPAGRKVVAVPSLWASPFVDNERRRRDRDRMLAALDHDEGSVFCALASTYRVTHVLRARHEEIRPKESRRLFLNRVFDNGKIHIDEVHGCDLADPSQRP